MKVTLVLCFLAMAVALVLGSGGHDDAHDAHGSGGHDAGGHAAGGQGGAGHGDDHGTSAATNLQLCSTLFSFVVLAALNKLR